MKSHLTFDKNGNDYCIPVIPQRDGRGKTESSFSPLHLVFVVPSSCRLVKYVFVCFSSPAPLNPLHKWLAVEA